MTKTNRVDYVRQWREKNRDKQRAYFAKYREEKKAKLNQTQKEYRERHKHSPEYKLRKNLRERLRNALKGLGRSKSTMTLLGCTVEEFKAHLEARFVPGMTWENYGEWHIDHIRPVTKFNLLLLENQLECFHYTNLQPLWAKDNIRKGNKLTASKTLIRYQYE